jgi:hypothetical protein
MPRFEGVHPALSRLPAEASRCDGVEGILDLPLHLLFLAPKGLTPRALFVAAFAGLFVEGADEPFREIGRDQLMPAGPPQTPQKVMPVRRSRGRRRV